MIPVALLLVIRITALSLYPSTASHNCFSSRKRIWGKFSRYNKGNISLLMSKIISIIQLFPPATVFSYMQTCLVLKNFPGENCITEAKKIMICLKNSRTFRKKNINPLLPSSLSEGCTATHQLVEFHWSSSQPVWGKENCHVNIINLYCDIPTFWNKSVFHVVIFWFNSEEICYFSMNRYCTTLFVTFLTTLAFYSTADNLLTSHLKVLTNWYADQCHSTPQCISIFSRLLFQDGLPLKANGGIFYIPLVCASHVNTMSEDAFSFHQLCWCEWVPAQDHVPMTAHDTAFLYSPSPVSFFLSHARHNPNLSWSHWFYDSTTPARHPSLPLRPDSHAQSHPPPAYSKENVVTMLAVPSLVFFFIFDGGEWLTVI